MQVFLLKSRTISHINNKEEITPDTFLITEKEADLIRETLEHNGYFWIIDAYTIGASGKQPSEVHKWNENVHDWEICEELIAQRKEKQLTEVWAELKNIRLQKNEGGVCIDGNWFHTDLNSQMLYHNLSKMVEIGTFEEELWRTMDNKDVLMTSGLLTKIQGGIYEQTKQNFDNAKTLYNLAKELVQPKEQDLSSGWSEQYQG